MAGGGGGQPSADERSSMNMIWAIIGIFLVGIFIWTVFGEQLKILFIKLRLYELYFINYIIQFIPLDLLNLSYMQEDVQVALDVAQKMDNSNLTADAASYLSDKAGSYLRYPFALIMLLFAYFGFWRNVTNRYKKRYDMHSLAKQESTEWPQINPVKGLDLVNQPLDDGTWSMGLNPVAFCKKHKLISVAVAARSEHAIGSDVKFQVTLDHDKTNRLFTRQLGKLWTDPSRLAIHKKALFTIFASRGCRDTKVSRNLVNQINISANSANPWVLDFTNVDKLWRKYYKQREVQEIINRHAYEYTTFIALLLFARQDGVLATADFLWLKPIDRELWYVLNSTGRQTYFTEAAGAHAHFLVEKALGRALVVPYVKEATKALQLALDEVVYVPDPEEKQQLLS